MTSSAAYLNPAEAARRLGVSAKALRVYEERGLLAPLRSEAGWRSYGPAEMARAREIVALRELGLSLGQVARVLGGDGEALEAALAGHQAILEDRLQATSAAMEKLGRLRVELAAGRTPNAGELAHLFRPAAAPLAAFDLPWPWGGERFELADVRALNYIVGPLGSGKTRLARRIAETLPGAVFLGMERTADGAAAARAQLAADPELDLRVQRTLAWLVDEGASVSNALVALLASLEAEAPTAIVIDLPEHELDAASQEALAAWLRRGGSDRRPLFLLTRSTAILDLEAVGPDETVILCPANHSPPVRVAPYPGAPGYEAVATCLASPEVRARTAGVIAWRPQTT